MDAFIESIFTFLKSIVESPEFRALIIGLITLGIGWISARRARQSIKAGAEKQASEQSKVMKAQYDQQIEAIELKQRDLLNKALEQYQELFTQERRKFDLKSKEFDALSKKYTEQGERVEILEGRVGELETGLSQYKLTVEQKDRIIQELTDNQAKMNERLVALERERDGLAKLAQEREGELQQRDATIADLRGKLETTEATVADLQQRITELEKKKTGELDPAKVPQSSPAPTPPAEGASPDRGSIGEVEKE